MLKRILSVMLVVATLLVAAAAPAFAQAPPNCERGQIRASQNALENGNLDQFNKHLNKGFDCFFGEPPGEGQ